jgi:hypothetical protein
VVCSFQYGSRFFLPRLLFNGSVFESTQEKANEQEWVPSVMRNDHIVSHEQCHEHSHHDPYLLRYIGDQCKCVFLFLRCLRKRRSRENMSCFMDRTLIARQRFSFQLFGYFSCPNYTRIVYAQETSPKGIYEGIFSPLRSLDVFMPA